MDENVGTEVMGLVQRSFLASPHVYKLMEMGASVGSVTHKEKFTFPSLSVSNRAQASSVLLPETLISSQFHVTLRKVGKPALSIQSCVRSFCPGSSFAPAVSLTQLRTASADENEMNATPRAKRDDSSTTKRKRGLDLVRSPNRFRKGLGDDVNIKHLVSSAIKAHEMACTDRRSTNSSFDLLYFQFPKNKTIVD